MATTRFSTPIGICALEWTELGLTAFSLPDSSAAVPEPSQTPQIISGNPEIDSVAERVRHHLGGEYQDFSDLPFDWTKVTPFQAKVLRAVLTISAGTTATYGDLARAIEARPGASRAVGQAVGANPWPLLVPCHRVLGAGGKLTGYSGPGGIRTKTRLLEIEGIELTSS